MPGPIYDPYASANDPAYDPESGPTPDALLEQLRMMGYTDKQIAALMGQQARFAQSTATSGQGAAASRAASSREQQDLENWWRKNIWENQQHQWNADFARKGEQDAIDNAYRQNTLAQRAYENLSQLKSPAGGWVDYWYRSRGRTTPQGGQDIPIEQALPAWARPATKPSTVPAWASAAVASPVAAGTPTQSGGPNPQNLAGVPIFTPQGDEYYADPRTGTKVKR